MQICTALEAAGIPCWIAPRDIPAGADYTEAIMTGLNDCRGLLLVYSRHAAASDPVLGEVERVTNRKKLVIPVRIENTPASKGMEFLISRRQWIDAYPPPVDRHLPAVVAEVERSLGMQSEKPVAPLSDVPEFIGPYRILGILGEGGMGIVYRGEQRTPINGAVAVKLIKAGFDTKEVIARFESERQALARMDHPHVAKVLEAGADPRGRPYFVMEYVPGRPITEFADEYKLTIRQRLGLFIQVCEAIAHAHSKGLIHRDIKASNVVAYMADGEPSVKVIDFGVAKALTGDRLTDRTQFTEYGQVVGTYDSMSPEQAAGSADIDTRSDVYSLGSLLYELLTGAKPFDDTTLARAADEEKRRIIREVAPPRPSTRVSGLGKEGAAVAAARQEKIESLARDLKSELEWIPLKALRKERDRRYASPLALADDVRNYLEGRPLVAAPESRVYRLRKWAARNRAALATAAAFLSLLLAGFAAYVYVIRAEQAKTLQALDRAEAAGKEEARQREIAVVAQQATERASQQLQATNHELDAAKKIAEAKTREAVNALKITSRQLALSYIDRGVNELENGDRWRGFAVLGQAYRMTSEFPDLRFSVRSLLGAWDGAMPRVCTHDLTVNAVAFSPDGTKIATASGYISSGEARLWDAATGRPLGEPMKHDGTVRSVVFSPDGRKIATASLGHTVRLWDAATGKPFGAPMNLDFEMNAVAFSPDSTKIATACGFLNSGEARLWDAATCKPLGAPMKHDGEVTAVAFSPDGTKIATASADDTARLWNVATAKPLGEPMRHGGKVNAVAFSVDGLKVVTASDDKTARLWDAATGRQLGKPLQHGHNVFAAVFSPDGTKIATASFDTRARLWDAATGELLGAPMKHSWPGECRGVQPGRNEDRYRKQ